MSTEKSNDHKKPLMWSKSSYSGDEGGQCVEVAATAKAVFVRDSKDRQGPQLSFTREAWANFTAFAARHA